MPLHERERRGGAGARLFHQRLQAVVAGHGAEQRAERQHHLHRELRRARRLVAVEMKLQAISEEMEYGTIVRWLKSEGERVTAGEIVVEVEAEKVTNELEAPVTGVLERIVAAEGDEIRAGATIAVFAEDR